MARGGRREGAGRPRGAATTRTREIADKAASEGLTPLEYMLSVMRNDGQMPDVRLDAAKSAAPYMHPRLAAVELSGDPDAPVGIALVKRVIADPRNPDR